MQTTFQGIHFIAKHHMSSSKFTISSSLSPYFIEFLVRALQSNWSLDGTVNIKRRTTFHNPLCSDHIRLHCPEFDGYCKFYESWNFLVLENQWLAYSQLVVSYKTSSLIKTAEIRELARMKEKISKEIPLAKKFSDESR